MISGFSLGSVSGSGHPLAFYRSVDRQSLDALVKLLFARVCLGTDSELCPKALSVGFHLGPSHVVPPECYAAPVASLSEASIVIGAMVSASSS